jgi:predicted ATPase/class 3 adenylate cyclase
MHARHVRGGTEVGQGARRLDLPSGVVTLVFTDVEGSTRLLRRLGSGFGDLLEAHNEIVRRSVADHGGVVVRGEGDSFFCAFADPNAAITACRDAQLRLSRFDWPPDAEFKVRIGLHTGPVEIGGEDYIGLSVHQAARVGDAAHGGQVVLSEATRQLLDDHLLDGTSFTRLGCYRLKDFAEPTVIYQLTHPELPHEFPALRAAPAAAHNVPEQATLFVGRQTALRELADLVASRRLVTVLGAGGVGKTRLAAEVVPLVLSRFEAGVWMVELAKLRDGHAVGDEVAATLGVRPEAERDIARTLAEALEGKQLLLLLDNCEHVLDELAPLVDHLIAACPAMHVLATSREPLALPGERRYPLAPLSLPDSMAELEGSEAVALFVDRAQVVAPGFDLTRERAAVVEICRRLDGLPLAIELAAARTAAIPPVRMAARLDRRFSVLRRSYRGRLPHHETLRASIEWSYELLEEDERTLLQRLSVFTGEFELEAAEQVCGVHPLERDDVLELLGRLIEKSLLQPADERYLMLESIRAFAREQLEETGEVETLVRAHLDYYTQLVERAAAAGGGPGQRAAFDRLDADLPDIRTAVERALERSDPTALRITASVGQYGFIRNRLREVAQWCIDAAAIPDAPPGLRARAYNQAGFALVLMGSPDGGQALVDDGLELARGADEDELLTEALLMAADLRLESGREEAARPLAAEAIDVAERIGSDGLFGRALLMAARAEHDIVGPEVTAARLSEAMSVFQRIGDRRQIGRVLLTRAFLCLESGDLEAARRDAAECEEICVELDHSIGCAMARTVSMWIAIDSGELELARTLLAECAATGREAGYRALLAYCLAGDAALCATAGEPDHAARVLGALGAATGAIGAEGGHAIETRLRRLRGELRAVLGERFEACVTEGERAGLEELAAQRL